MFAFNGSYTFYASDITPLIHEHTSSSMDNDTRFIEPTNF